MSSCLFKLALLSIYFYRCSVPLGTLLPSPPEPGPGHQPQTHQETPVLEGRHGKILELGPQCLPFIKHILPVNHYGRFPKPQTTEINVTRATGQSSTWSITPAKGRCVHVPICTAMPRKQSKAVLNVWPSLFSANCTSALTSVNEHCS